MTFWHELLSRPIANVNVDQAYVFLNEVIYLPFLMGLSIILFVFV